VFSGLDGVLGFALVSTIASFFTMIWSIQVLFHCCKCCGGEKMYEDCCKYVSDKLRNLAKTNFSAGKYFWYFVAPPSLGLLRLTQGLRLRFTL